MAKKPLLDCTRELKRVVTALHERLCTAPGSIRRHWCDCLLYWHVSPEAAHSVVDEIYRAIQSLVLFPYKGHRRLDLTSRTMRFIRVRDYLIAYAPEANPLWIIAVIHGYRSPRVMAAILRRRAEH